MISEARQKKPDIIIAKNDILLIAKLKASPQKQSEQIVANAISLLQLFIRNVSLLGIGSLLGLKGA